jgi:hypothetical protein
MKQPSVKEKAFSCPHCGAFTTQYWYEAWADRIAKEPLVPFVFDEASYIEILNDPADRDEGIRPIESVFTRPNSAADGCSL